MAHGTVDLGRGVLVRRDGRSLVVLSRELALPWRPSAGAVPGTAVRWGDDWWEVVDHGGGADTRRWQLEPWEDGVVMRDSFALDPLSLSALAATLQTEHDERQRRAWMTLAAPLLGFVPAEVQQHWGLRWGYPARLATASSALLEMVAGGVGIVQLLLLVVSAQWFLPGALRWLAFVGPLLFLEAVMRLHHVNAHSEPIGSLIVAVPLLPFTTRRRTEPRRVVERGALATVAWTAMITIPMFFSPRRHQEAWGRRLAVWPLLLTLLSALCEVVGGVVDITRDGAGTGALTLVSLVVLADGLARLVLAALTRAPVGSLFGLPFLRYYDGWVARM